MYTRDAFHKKLVYMLHAHAQYYSIIYMPHTCTYTTHKSTYNRSSQMKLQPIESMEHPWVMMLFVNKLDQFGSYRLLYTSACEVVEEDAPGCINFLYHL